MKEEWSDWDERHGRLSREVAVERGGSRRDTMERLGGAIRHLPDCVGNSEPQPGLSEFQLRIGKTK